MGLQVGSICRLVRGDAMHFLLLFGFLFSIAFGGTIVDWTDSDLASFEGRSKIDRFYFFHADWCGACRRFKPEFESALTDVFAKYPKLEVIRINLDKAPLLSKGFKLSHLPSVFYESNGAFRNVNTFKGNLMKLLNEKQWEQIEPIRFGDSQRARQESPHSSRAIKSKLVEWIEANGGSLPAFITAVSLLALIIILFVIWLVWLYTDYKLNGHRLTEESIQKRLRLLRKFENEKYGKDRDSSSDDESETESATETEPLQGKRKSAKHQ